MKRYPVFQPRQQQATTKKQNPLPVCVSRELLENCSSSSSSSNDGVNSVRNGGGVVRSSNDGCVLWTFVMGFKSSWSIQQQKRCV
jgi:hypothetical protein